MDPVRGGVGNYRPPLPEDAYENPRPAPLNPDQQKAVEAQNRYEDPRPAPLSPDQLKQQQDEEAARLRDAIASGASPELLNMADSFKPLRTQRSMGLKRERDLQQSRSAGEQSSAKNKNYLEVSRAGRKEGESDKEYATRLIAARNKDQGKAFPSLRAKTSMFFKKIEEDK
jgi:hypothetical protein